LTRYNKTLIIDYMPAKLDPTQRAINRKEAQKRANAKYQQTENYQKIRKIYQNEKTARLNVRIDQKQFIDNERKKLGLSITAYLYKKLGIKK
jgi:ribosome-binding protein aMBF1 (putative translation factor)